MLKTPRLILTLLSLILPIYGQTNLALNKPVIASGPVWRDQARVARLVDGNSGSVTHSGDGANSAGGFYYQIDLEESFSLKRIEVQNRTGCCPERLSNYQVTLFDDDGNGGAGAQTWSANVRTDNSNSGDGGVDALVATDGTGIFRGRHVRVTALTNRNFSPQIAEVRVFEADMASITSFTADTNHITQTGAPGLPTSATLSWSAELFDTLTISPGPGTVSSPGSLVVSPTTTTTYTLTATNSIGTSTQEITIGVDEPVLPLVLNEVLASNRDGLLDEDGDSSDWIEIYNPGFSPVDASGYRLSSASSATNWFLPSGTTIEPMSYLLIFASEKNRIGSELHTSFNLSATADTISLFDTGNVQLGSFSWTAASPQMPDISLGLFEGNERLFVTPTPAAENSSTFFAFGEVTYSEESQLFVDSITVALTPTVSGSIIHYTTDGSVPNASSPVYSSPLVFTTNVLLRARLEDPSVSGSLGEISSRQYSRISNSSIASSFNAGVTQLADFQSDLPVLVIDTFAARGANTSSNTPGAITIYEPDSVSGLTSFSDLPTESSRMTYRIRGASSAGFPKKQYRMELVNQEDNDKNRSLLGMPSESDWVLSAQHLDDSLIRQKAIFELGRSLGMFAPRSQYCEVFINEDGGPINYQDDYVGIYLLTESIKRDEDRIDIQRLDPSVTTEPDISGGYILSWEALVAENNPSGFPNLEIREPEPIPMAQLNWIVDHLNDFSNVLDGSVAGDYRDFVDVTSYANLFVINELSRDQDAYIRSSYFYKDRGEKIRMDALWDYDRTLGNGSARGSGRIDGWQYIENVNFQDRNWEVNIIQDNDFEQAFVDQWQSARGDQLSNTSWDELINAQRDTIAGAFERNRTRWTSVANISPLATEVADLKSWSTARLNWIDGEFVAQPLVSLPSGTYAPGATTNFSSTAGTVYYTTDGSDPRGADGIISPTASSTANLVLNTNTTVTARTRVAQDQWSGPVEVTYFVDVIPASSTNLVISEFHYRPASRTTDEINQGVLDRDDFEFIELENIAAVPIDLSGASFTEGISYTFGSGTILPAGGRLILVRDPFAFSVRYPAVSSAEQYEGGLSNGGEQITLTAQDGTIIKDFIYSDSAPWPTATDGPGFSLVLRRPENNPDHSLAASWRVSGFPDGNPLATDSLIFTGDPNGDSDGDGVNDLVQHALGQGQPVVLSSVDLQGAPFLQFEFQRNIGADDVTVVPEVSTDLIDWEPMDISLQQTASILNGDGTESLTYRSSGSSDGFEKLFIRIRVSQD